MNTRFRVGLVRLVLLSLLVLSGSWPALAAEYEGVQPMSGARYRIVVPEGWNGRLVAFAHGYVFPLPGVPLGFFDTLPDGTNIADVVTSLGYAYAVTSYRQNGLAILEGSEDILELVRDVFPAVVGTQPRFIYLVGASQGGLVTTRSVERHPWLYAGGLAACGPIGSFREQIDYFGNARVLFDYFFPGVIPGSPIAIPPAVIAGWATFYAPAVAAAVGAQPGRAAEAARVAGLAFDPHNPATLVESWTSVLTYNVYSTNDATAKLRGNPYDNRRRIYFGSSNDLRLNLRVQRFAAVPSARAALRAYETTGVLAPPLVTLHTALDPIVPYWHEFLYRAKTLISGSWVRHVNVPIFRYGHCAFTREELVFAFGMLVLQVEGF